MVYERITFRVYGRLADALPEIDTRVEVFLS